MKDLKFYERNGGITEHNATENQELCQQKKQANCFQMILMRNQFKKNR